MSLQLTCLCHETLILKFLNHKTVFFQEFANFEKIEIGTPGNFNQSIKLKTTEVVQALETLK